MEEVDEISRRYCGRQGLRWWIGTSSRRSRKDDYPFYVGILGIPPLLQKSPQVMNYTKRRKQGTALFNYHSKSRASSYSSSGKTRISCLINSEV